MKLIVATFAATLGNVRSNRGTAPPHLASETVKFLTWKAGSGSIHFQGELMRSFPNLQVSEVLHSSTSLDGQVPSASVTHVTALLATPNPMITKTLYPSVP